jgi:glycerol-3-phosphate dehydrogenase
MIVLTFLHLSRIDSKTLAIELIQKYGMSEDVAANLAKSYGSRAWEVCKLTQPTDKRWPKFGKKIAEMYPYVDADVVWACREYACTIEDVLSRRTRLAFLNKDAALEAIPVVADIMAAELGWSSNVKKEQIAAAEKYVNSYAGRLSDATSLKLKSAKYQHLKDVFDAIDSDENESLDKQEVAEVAQILGLELSKKELDKVFKEMDKAGNGRVGYESFEEWWMEDKDNAFQKHLSSELGFYVSKDKALKEMGGGIFFG